MEATKTKKKFKLPHLGMRIVKTGISVFFCLLLNYLFSPQVALISSLAAIVTMQSSLENTMKTAVGRFVGTAIGGGAGLAMLPMAQNIEIEWLYLFLMPLGMIAIIYICVLVKVPQSVSICAFVYITVLIVPFNPSSTANPYLQGIIRIADTAVGVVIALLVNRFIAPPKPKPVTSVHVVSNTFNQVYDKVKSELTGIEQLMLYDTGLIDPSVPRDRADVASSGIPIRACTQSVRVPVPTEFKSTAYIDAAYVSRDYSVVSLYIRQTNGYIQLPCETFPVTVVWHVDAPSGHETYGLLRGAKRFRSFRQLQQAQNQLAGTYKKNPPFPRLRDRVKKRKTS